MASIGRSFKPPSLLTTMAASRRPGMQGRSVSNLSNTSEMSSAPSSPGDFNHDEILFSARPSPTPQGSPWPDLAKRPSEMHLKLPGTLNSFIQLLLLLLLLLKPSSHELFMVPEFLLHISIPYPHSPLHDLDHILSSVAEAHVHVEFTCTMFSSIRRYSRGGLLPFLPESHRETKDSSLYPIQSGPAPHLHALVIGWLSSQSSR
ncbi:hypothetical protein BKA67DRAFT_335779 [Truncatella angustata]|uniref:Uncharacterized protein n=1 Tax=Truncatella angustata TaxID=152316 RepID=A0A9P8UGE6_9PEZI|nr:uncharacterized protein BKA67DRAFT_335779 [Truncatella angustata]KAH6651729.1 hypothetical protein BKA67DRAFT_335779 [Truncatella angustata]